MTPPEHPVGVPVLEDDAVRLEPLRLEHAPALREAAAGPRDTFDFTAVPTPETVDAFITAHLARAASGAFWPMVQMDVRAGRAVGMTAFAEPRWWPETDRLIAIEIGSTWLHPAAQGTAINPAAKRLLLSHAFDTLGVSRVDIKTDARNARARASILATGATFEGVLRNWQPSGAPGEDGRTRDTAMHSITADEWPTVRTHLDARIATKLDHGRDRWW